jgi:hypothetical protein
VARSFVLPVALLFGVLANVSVLRCAALEGLDDERRAARVLAWHGIACSPKLVERSEGELRVVCADGKHVLAAQPTCDESWPCVLGLDVACWELEEP